MDTQVCRVNIEFTVNASTLSASEAGNRPEIRCPLALRFVYRQKLSAAPLDYAPVPLDRWLIQEPGFCYVDAIEQNGRSDVKFDQRGQ